MAVSIYNYQKIGAVSHSEKFCNFWSCKAVGGVRKVCISHTFLSPATVFHGQGYQSYNSGNLDLGKQWQVNERSVIHVPLVNLIRINRGCKSVKPSYVVMHLIMSIRNLLCQHAS
jgi:hypothetical protein